jgi:rhodanese-related sulfurtransferase
MDNVNIISRDQLLDMIKNKENFKLVEVLSREQYAGGHLPSAISLPVNEIIDSAGKIFPDKKEKIVVYCMSFECQASTAAAQMLQGMGYENVLDYKGGKQDWLSGGQNFEK